MLESIRRWSDFLEVSDLASSTTRQYRRTLLNFVADTMLDLSVATEDDVVSYLTELSPNGHMRGRVLRALKSYYRWRRGPDPTRRLRIPRPKYGPAPTLSREQVRAIIKAAMEREPRRGWAITFAYHTGARIASLVAVRSEDVGDHTVTFRVTKGGRPYAVPLSREAKIAAHELLALRHKTLFGVGEGQFWNWVRQAGSDTGIHVWPHLLRHSFATHLYEMNPDPLLLKELLNHADLSQVPRYAHVAEDRKREAVQMAFR